MSALDTWDLDSHLERVRAMCIVGSTSDADTEHLASMLYEMCEMVERAQKCVADLKTSPTPPLVTQPKRKAVKR